MSETVNGLKHLFWIHGWATSPDIWRSVAAQLPQWTHHFFSYSSCQTTDDLRLQFDRQLSHIGEPLHVIGWSLGGMLALEKWLDQPGPMEQLTVIGSTLCFCNRDRSLGWPQPAVRLMKLRLQAELADQPQRQSATLKAFREVAGQLPDDTDFSDAGLLAGLDYLLAHDLRSRWLKPLPHTNERINWIHGDQDAVCPPQAVPREPGERIHMLRGAGHAPFLSHPAECLQTIRRLLSGD